jgi:pimeloyl-ACP methyl ester carboxylesterase
MALLSHAQRAGMRAMGAMWARPMVHPAVVGGPVFEQVLAMLERSSPAQFAAQINALLTRPDAAPVLAGINCPTLVLTGRQDAWSPPEQHQAMVDAMHTVRAELVVLEGCGHMSTMEQPDAVNTAFARWLAA